MIGAFQGVYRGALSKNFYMAVLGGLNILGIFTYFMVQ